MSHFDMICGTSAGGLIALALGIKKMSLPEAKIFFERNVQKVFEQPNSIPLPSKHSHQNLEGMLQKTLGNSALCDFPPNQSNKTKHVFVVAATGNTLPSKVWEIA